MTMSTAAGTDDGVGSTRGPVPLVERFFVTVGRDVANGAGAAWRNVADAGRATGTAVRRAAVETGEVVADGSVAAARGARTGVAWTVLQWRMERNGRRGVDNTGVERGGVDARSAEHEHRRAAAGAAKATKRPTKSSGKRAHRPSARS